MITFVEIHHFCADKCEIIEDATHLFLIFRGDVSLAESHEILKVIAGIMDEAAHGGIGHFILDECYRTHVKLDELGHIFHFVVLRQSHPAENPRYHLRSDEVMVMESPSELFIPAFGDRLCNVVHERAPTQPHVIAFCSYVVEHGKRMVEIILMSAPFDHFHTLHGGKFRENYCKQPGFQQEIPADRRTRCAHYFHKFIDDTLMRDYADAFGVAPYGFKGLRPDGETELCGEADGAHHAQGIIAESHVRVERCAEQAFFHVAETVEKIHELAEAYAVDPQCERIDSEVAARQVLFESAVLHDRFA